MKKEELLKKWSKSVLSECAFWEDLEPNKPFYYKAEQIAKNLNMKVEEAEEALKDYQHYQEY